MSQIAKVQQLKSLTVEKRKHFHRALDLNINVGSETMRDLANLYLERKGVSLKQHVGEPCVKRTIKEYKNLPPEQFQTLSSSAPSLHHMDISLLTVLLLKTFPEQLTPEARKSINELKQIRNTLAHAVKAELDDDTIFKDTRQSILSLGKEISVKRRNYSHELFSEINDIRRQELVYSHCNLDRIKLNNEVYVIKVVEATDDESANSSSASPWMIKIGLTKWVRQLARGIDVSTFLHMLKEENVISDTTKRQIEDEYSYEEQMQQLVLHMMNETTVNLCKLCQCLRQLAPVMADLVENSNTDGREIEQYLKEYEEEKVKEILKEHLMERENKSIPTERLHIFVEKRFGVRMAFKKIQMYVRAVFPNVRYTTEDFSFIGLVWRNETKEGNDEVSDNGTENVNVSLMTCETFASFMGNCISKLDERLAGPLSRAIREQTIAPSIFLEMSPDDMKDVFSPYIEHSHDNKETNLKYGFGVKKFLESKKNEIRDHSDIKVTTEAVENLRLFDSPFTRLNYQRLKVQPNLGNLLIPAHEFRCLPTSKIYIEHFVVKEVIKFTAACINGRKNGTIHFGIEHSGNCIGKIKGMQNSKLWNCLDKEIGEAINVCFKENACVAFKCVRPAQFIPVEGDGIVIEIDVVPFSEYISKSFLQIFFPPKGNQKQQCYVYSLKPDAGILPVSEHAIQESENFYENVLQERMNLEQFNDNRISTSNLLEKQLRKMLTGGNIFKLNPAVVFKLLHCNSHFIEMTKVERESLEFTDIEIISGEEYIDQEAQMTPEDTRRIATENHQHEIEQHPGAGGSTLGIMEAKVRRNQAFTQRVKEDRQHLEQICNQQVDERDLLVYLGDKINTLSNQGPNTHSSVVCSMEEYKRLLSYSTKLVAKQTQATASKRFHLETFLYYAMLHWPLKTRTMLDVEAMSKPTTYEQLIKKWEESYHNFYIKTLDQGRMYRPKNCFVLGKGSPGNDIVDLESIKREWMDRKKKETGRVRKPVYKDFFWRETFVEERLARLKGFVDDTGNTITHEAEYVNESYKFRIRTYYPCPDLSNRAVTFVLGFTWKEPVAFDVVEFGKEGNSSLGNETLESESDKGHGKRNNGDEESEILYERSRQTDGGNSTDQSKRRRKRGRGKHKQKDDVTRYNINR